MTMTEDEAKSKWCPFARVASPMAVTPPGSTTESWIGVAGANRGALSPRVGVQGTMTPSNPESAHCIGSACMAWRTSDRKVYRHEELAQEQSPPGEGWYLLNPRQTGSARLWMRDVPLGVEGGFCGLAGAPQ